MFVPNPQRDKIKFDEGHGMKTIYVRLMAFNIVSCNSLLHDSGMRVQNMEQTKNNVRFSVPSSAK